MKTQVTTSGLYKVQDEKGNKIDLEFPEIKTPERTAFSLSGLRHHRDRFEIGDNGDSVPVAWSASLQREASGRTMEPHELAALRKMYDRLPTDLILLQDCDECNGDGFIGDFSDGTAELCSSCLGYGVQLSPFLVLLVRALDWLKSPEKKIDEATIEKKNRAALLRKEAEKKKKALAEEHAAKLREAQQEKFRQIQAKTQEQVAKEQERIDRELQEQLAALEKQD